MKKILYWLIVIGYWLLAPFAVVEAGFLKYDPSTASPASGATFQLAVVVDTGADQINSTDIYVTYDAALLEAQSVAAGSFFPTVTNNITSGRVYIAGMVDDPASSKTGSGTVATITFKGLKAGSATVSFDCTSSKIVKNDINATNALVCGQNVNASVTVGTGTGTTSTGTTSTGGTTTGGDALPSRLPQSGIFDEMVKWSKWGSILVILGGAVRLLLL